MASTLRFLCKQIHWSLLSVFKVVSMCARTRWHGAFWFTSHSSPAGPSHPPRQSVATSASVRPVGSFEGKGGWTDHVAVLPPSLWTINMMGKGNTSALVFKPKNTGVTEIKAPFTTSNKQTVDGKRYGDFMIASRAFLISNYKKS